MSNRAIGYEIESDGLSLCQMTSCTSHERDQNAAFIAHARTFSPEAAKVLLTTIEGLEEIQSTFPHRHASGIAEKALNQICEEWKK